MNGNIARHILILGLLFQSRALHSAQIQVNGGQVIVNGGQMIVNGGQVLVDAAGQIHFINNRPNNASNPPPVVSATGDLLEFEDGSMMHGELKRMDTASGLQWDTSAAKAPIDLQPTHLDSIRFVHADSILFAPTAHLRFVNGDDLFGSITSLDDEHLVFNTWFGGAMTIQRAAVQSITMLSSNYNILYEGPGDASGWIIGNHNPESWTLVDGAFISGIPGTLGRDFKLSGSSTIEFDLAWTDTLELQVFIYSDAVDHLNAGDSYLLQFRRGEVSFNRIDPSHQFPFKTFGSAPLNLPAGKNKARVTIQSNKEEGTVAVFIDNVLVKRWKDDNGLSINGGGVLFQQTTTADGNIKLSNFKVSQWSGRFEPETSAVATNTDVVRFINHDKAAGKITGINNGKVTLIMGETTLPIPLQRITQINFTASPAVAAARGPWEVRAYFPRGGSVSFQLQEWNDKKVSGTSAIFGALAFQPGQIRELEFNLGHPKMAVPLTSDREFEGLDE